jgi:small subunit ribosomal protein S21
MPISEIQVRKGESIDRVLKRLKTKLESEGIFDEIRRLRSYERPPERIRRKARNKAKKGKVKFRFQLHDKKDAPVVDVAAVAAAE